MIATKPTCLAIPFLALATLTHADTFQDLLSEYFEPLPSEDQLDMSDPITLAQVELGKTLYFDTRLSADWDISCATCHDIYNGGDDGLALSVGHQGQLGGRNAPTVLNAFFNVAQFWDGRADTLADQAKGPIQAPVEMANTPEKALATLNAIPWYRHQFQAAFPDQPDPLTFDNLATAIEAFETTLITPSPFDQFLNGDESALDPDALFGAFTFLDTGCIVCHNGVNVGGGFFERLGMVNEVDPNIFPPSDVGLFGVTQDEGDKNIFKVASLRNVTLTGPYFHSGRVDSLAEAVNIMAKAQLGSHLSQDDTQSIIAFLTSLEGKPLDIEVPDMPDLDPVLAPSVVPEHLAALYPPIPQDPEVDQSPTEPAPSDAPELPQDTAPQDAPVDPMVDPDLLPQPVTDQAPQTEPVALEIADPMPATEPAIVAPQPTPMNGDNAPSFNDTTLVLDPTAGD